VWEGSVPREEPQHVLVTCHTCCPSSVVHTKAYLQWREEEAHAAGRQVSGLCSLHTPSLAQAQPHAPVPAGRMAGSRLLLGRGKIEACPATGPLDLCVCRHWNRQRFFPPVWCQQPQGSPLYCWPGTSMVALASWRTPAASLSTRVWTCCWKVQTLPLQSLLPWQMLSIPRGSAGICFPMPCLHPCPAVLACQPCGPHCRVGSRAEDMVVPTFACFVVASPQC